MIEKNPITVATKRLSLADEVYMQLMSQMAHGKFEVGEKLASEHKLAEEFSVSRPVVRQALHRLTSDEIIVSRRGSGSFVLRLPPSEMDLAKGSIGPAMRAYEVRFALEPEIARLAALRHDPRAISLLGKAFDELRDQMLEDQNAMLADQAFHMAIAQATGNELFHEQLELLNKWTIYGMQIASKITTDSPGNRRDAVIREHAHILDAIKLGDQEGAKLFMQYHLRQVRRRITNRDYKS